MADEARVAVRGSGHIAPVVVKAVVGAVSPEEIPIGGHRDLLREMQFQGWGHIEKVGWADQGDLAEIRAPGKQGVERAKRIVAWIGIAANHVRAQCRPRGPGDILKRVPGFGGDRPCNDVIASEGSPLEYPLEVVVPRPALAVQPTAEGMP